MSVDSDVTADFNLIKEDLDKQISTFLEKDIDEAEVSEIVDKAISNSDELLYQLVQVGLKVITMAMMSQFLDHSQEDENSMN